MKKQNKKPKLKSRTVKHTLKPRMQPVNFTEVRKEFTYKPRIGFIQELVLKVRNYFGI